MRKAIPTLFLFVFAFTAFGQNQQINPQNSYTQVSGINPATVTITGVAGQRVRLYQVSLICNTTGATAVPVLYVTDAGNTAILYGPLSPGGSNVNGIYKWEPGFAFSVGGTIVITGNYGAGCSGGTTMVVQADQF